MNRQEAKEILSAYRHGTDDEKDPTFAEALALARRDEELSKWLAESLEFDRAVRRDVAQVAAPMELRDRILASQKIIRPTPWWNPRLSGRQLAAAAAVVVALGVAALWMGHRPSSFEEFQREIVDQSWGPTPHVEVKAASLGDVREFLAGQGISTNFAIPETLMHTKVRGCSLVHWEGHEVPVICFNSEGQHLHLVVAPRSLFPDAPTESPLTDQWQSWRTASWSKDDHSYVLTGLNTTAFLKKFRKDRRWDWGG